MTLVVVALASVVLTWGIGQVSSSRAALTGAVNDRMDRMQEGINIEDVQMLSTSTLRLYIRNTGSIQSVIDAVYVNNTLSPISGVCPPGSVQAGQLPVTISTVTTTTTTSVTFPSTEPSSASLTVSLTPTWTVTTTSTTTITTGTVSATGVGTAGFTALIGSPHPGGSIAWSTNFKSCPTGSRLSLPIGAFGAVDVSVPTSASSCSPTPPVCPGTAYTVTASTDRGTTATGSFTV